VKYLVIIERTEHGFSAYSPDMDGCVATGKTRREVEKRMREAIALHIDGLKRAGCDVPEPRAYSTYLDLPA
jgi:predicted RNase H-like HicB family nuclease